MTLVFRLHHRRDLRLNFAVCRRIAVFRSLPDGVTEEKRKGKMPQGVATNLLVVAREITDIVQTRKFRHILNHHRTQSIYIFREEILLLNLHDSGHHRHHGLLPLSEHRMKSRASL